MGIILFGAILGAFLLIYVIDFLRKKPGVIGKASNPLSVLVGVAIIGFLGYLVVWIPISQYFNFG